ncbi:MFS transporter [Oerskovia rustica]|uniref:MFS transporter n=1 Tax=Oerskovia rustica TaxID=2762237 RepID=A0ABR8RPU9_9CELL|nr:MFS transporter [Oerskovia rustica]MBD7949815.1 MFS transporter [Oerskovia rustica]
MNLSPHAPRSRTRLVAALALATLLASLGTSIANVALPTLAHELGAPFGQVQWVVLSYLLAMTVTAVAVGRLGDTLGRQRVLLAGLGVFTVATLACALAPSLAVLVAARSLQGVGAAVMIALPLALVRDVVPEAHTGAAMGLLGTTSAAGTALGPAGGGLLIATSGWQAGFVAMLPLASVALVLTWRGLGDAPAPVRSGARFDVAGAVVLTGALVVGALAMTPGAVPQVGAGPLLAGAAVLVVLLVVVERRSAAPLVPWELLRARALSGGLLMNLLVATVMMSTLVVGPFYLAGGLGLDEAAIGLTLAVGPVVSALTGVVAGKVVDRAGAGAMTTAALLTMTAGAVLLVALPHAWGLPGYVLALVVLTPGYQLFLAANNTAVMTTADGRRRGTVSGVLSLSRNLGLIAGASVMGAVFATATGSVSVHDATAASSAAGMRATFLVATALLALAAVVSLAVRRRADRPVSPAGVS